MHALLGVALRELQCSVHARAFCSGTSRKDVYDVAVVGAGLTGAALAAGLGGFCFYATGSSGTMVFTDHALFCIRRINQAHSGSQGCSYRQTGHYKPCHSSDHMLQTHSSAPVTLISCLIRNLQLSARHSLMRQPTESAHSRLPAYNS